ncbi:undecaprenyl-phosphate glucose phosphotransferase [Mesorhizobium koreense]|uniref:undecaprenyl-phosphate glucose phosphotransferase n=1 Tax=Mesorhizobium koreense TaxID=3074855 RepID=UPI00287B6335|nr:undecaprenyl-phosphate glucose phosphotransferase [Mesorhizobium sp. WR6]
MNQLPNVVLNQPPTTRPARFSISSTVISGIAVLLDSAMILGAGLITYLFLISVNVVTGSFYATCICCIWITVLLLFQFSELYRFDAIIRPLPNLDKMIIAFATGFLFLLAAAFAVKLSSTLSRAWIGAFGASTMLLTLTGRIILSRSVLYLCRKGVFSRNMIIVGSQRNVTRLTQRMLDLNPGFITVTALFLDLPSDVTIQGTPVMGNLEAIPSFVRASRVDDIVIALPWSDEHRILALVEKLRELPVNIYLGSDLIGFRLDFSEAPGHFESAPIFSVAGHPMSGWAVAIKAAEDYVLCSVLLAVAAIPMAFIALLVRLDSPGPVIFRQERLGFNNGVFQIYKFRTMRISEPGTITVQAKKADPRVTRIGRFLRRSSLDELPQLFNVLLGNMSLIGPRPHAVDHNAEYSRLIRGYFARHRVKPGMTGWAQVNGLRGETKTTEKMEARIRHDVYYTENWSLGFDLLILLRTAVVLITGQNAY